MSVINQKISKFSNMMEKLISEN